MKLSEALIWCMVTERDCNDRSEIYGFTQRTFAYNSNKIEGSTLTEDQTAALFEEGFLPTHTCDGANEHDEAMGMRIKKELFLKEKEKTVIHRLICPNCGGYWNIRTEKIWQKRSRRDFRA